jgi:hypothetical protein
VPRLPCSGTLIQNNNAIKRHTHTHLSKSASVSSSGAFLLSSASSTHSSCSRHLSRFLQAVTWQYDPVNAQAAGLEVLVMVKHFLGGCCY